MLAQAAVVLLLTATGSAPRCHGCHGRTWGVPRTVGHNVRAGARVSANTAAITAFGGNGPLNPGGHGGNSGSGGGGGPGPHGDGEDSWKIHQLIVDNGLHATDLPADLQLAMARGQLSLPHLTNYIAVLRNPTLRALSRASAFFRNKLIANPRLGTVIAVETSVGVATMLVAEAKARGARFADELDFVLCDLALLIATNVALVLTLSPSAALGAVGSAGTAATARGARSTKALLNSLPSTFLQPGAFSPIQRAACYLRNAAQFGAIGVASSALGASATKALVSLRERVTGTAPDVELAPVKRTALAYGGFVSTSSSTRYQLVNALEASVFPRLPLRTGPLSFFVRTGNNFLGGVHWIRWARFLGVQ